MGKEGIVGADKLDTLYNGDILPLSTMIGYKAANSGDVRVIVTLEIPPDAQTNMDRRSAIVKETASYRTDKAKVLKIEDLDGNSYKSATSFLSDKKIRYTCGKIIIDPTFNKDIEKVDTEGIHFFLTRRVCGMFSYYPI